MGTKFVITCGDVAGCSPWLALDLLEERDETESFVYVGPAALRGFLLKKIDADRLDPGVEWVEVGRVESSTIASGDPSPRTGRVAHRALEEAVKVTGQAADGLMTLPLAKHQVQAGGYPNFTGHTEFLEEFYGTSGVMTFFGESLTVALLTRHIPLRAVPEHLNPDRIETTVRTVAAFFQRTRDLNPTMALLGLNPHAGEQGQLGTEDQDILKPSVESLKKEGYRIDGPHPADSYLPAHGGSVDVILACYHDQGLVPFKQNHLFDGVHATLGLPVRRVSPDHGIAADKARSGDVDPRSALNCLRWLRRWSTEST